MLLSKFNTTVVMLTWNALDHTKVTLESLLNSNEDFKLLIFDNGSNSEVVNYLDKIQLLNNRINVVLSKENIGVWNARYKSAQLVDTEFVCLIDSDLYFPSIWLTPMLEMFNEKNVAQVGPLKLSKRLKHPYLPDINFKEFWKLCEKEEKDPMKQLSKFIGNKDFEIFINDLTALNCWSTDIDIPTRSIGGCVSLTRTSFLLDERFNDPYYGKQKYGMEDIDFSWSLHKYGYKIKQCSSVYIHHFEHSSMENNKIQADNQGDLLNEDTSNYIYFINKWEGLLNNWMKQKLINGSSVNDILKDDLINLLFKKVPNHIPSKIKQTLNFINY